MVRRCPVCSGVSRSSRTSRRRSFNVTSAARVRRLAVTPVATSDIVRTEQGATIMPRVRNEPLLIDAPRSPTGWQTVASRLTSAGLRSVSYAMVISAAFDITRWVSTGSPRSSSSNRMP